MNADYCENEFASTILYFILWPKLLILYLLFSFGAVQIGNPPTLSFSIGAKSQKRCAGPSFHGFMIVTNTMIDSIVFIYDLMASWHYAPVKGDEFLG